MARTRPPASPRKPLDPALYSPAQCLAAVGELPLDHPAWRATAQDERDFIQTRDSDAADAAVAVVAGRSNAFGSGLTKAEYQGRGGNACECTVCGLLFTSIGPFDEHRTGNIHHHDPAKDTRRCRTPDELRARGIEPNAAGQWRRPRPVETLPNRKAD